MTGLVRLLAAILGAHIERDDLPAAEPSLDDRLRAVASQTVVAFTPVADALRQVANDLAVAAVTRPCWACGDPVGFHVEHRPCWDVPPFTRTAVPPVRTFAEGGLL